MNSSVRIFLGQCCAIRVFVVFCSLLLLMAGMGKEAFSAEPYPTRPIRFVVPFASGGPTDTIARLIGQKMTDTWGQPVLVDSRPGGDTIIGTEFVAKAAADGYTILLASPSFVVNPSLHPKLPYDTVRDFSPVNFMGTSPLVLVVHPSVPARTVAELIALAKAKPGALNFASNGPGSPTHLSAELLRLLVGIDLVPVGYKGAAQGITDLLAGQVQMMFPAVRGPLAQIRSGKLRALAVTSSKRTRVLPDTPTMIEAGVPGFEVFSWYGVLAPGRTPRPTVEKLHAEIGRIVQTTEMGEKFGALGIDPASMSPDGFGKFITSEIAKWSKVTKQSSARPQ